MRIVYRRRMSTGHNECRDVRDIGQQVRADLVRNLSELCKIYFSRISTGTTHNQSGFGFHSLVSDGIVVQKESLLIHGIAFYTEEFIGKRTGSTVRRVSSLLRAETQYLIAWLQHRGEHNLVRGCAGMGLNIGILCAKGLFCPGDRKSFYFVNDFTAAVQSCAGKTFRSFVLDHRAQCRQNRP